jgi:hypothetical protein
MEKTLCSKREIISRFNMQDARNFKSKSQISTSRKGSRKQYPSERNMQYAINQYAMNRNEVICENFKFQISNET